jgi:outer membrane protein OmpA-like peptidoglycan-associated protein
MKKNNIFWISYSDLMTSLFFVMLVLFVAAIGLYRHKLKTTKEQLKKIQEIHTATQALPKKYFQYEGKYKRFKLKRRIQFETGSAVIDTNYDKYLINVGESIAGLIIKLKNDYRFSGLNIKYMVIIEGMASKDKYRRNFELSYERALALYRFWKKHGISFDPNICEIQISGSGIEGIREYYGKEEYKNQQFLIQVIPKIGKIQGNEN